MTTATAMLASSIFLGLLFSIPAAFVKDVGFSFQLVLVLSIGLFMAYVAVGLPAHLFLRWKNFRSLGAYAVAGAAIGASLSPISVLLDSEIGPNQISVVRLAVAATRHAMAASLAAAVFWIILRLLTTLRDAR